MLVRLAAKQPLDVLVLPIEAAIKLPGTTQPVALGSLSRRGGAALVGLLRALMERLCAGDDVVVLHTVAEDAGFQGARGGSLGRGIDRRLAQCLGRLRAKAPFGALRWREVQVASEGREASVALEAPDGNTVTLALAVKGAGVTGGYRLARPAGAASTEIAGAVRAAMAALSAV